MAVAAILAGGRSRRMGRPKPAVMLAGRPLIAYPLRAAREAGLEPFVVSKRGSDLPALDCEIVREPGGPTHPLAGIVAALDAAHGDDVLVLGCDMPFLTPGLLAALARRPAPAATSVGGRLEPLLAVYGAAAREPLAGALDRRLPLRAALEDLRPALLAGEELARFGDPARLVFSVNSPEDLERAAAWGLSPG